MKWTLRMRVFFQVVRSIEESEKGGKAKAKVMF